MKRSGTRLLAVAIGVIAGLVVLAAFASRLGLVGGASSPTPATASGAAPASVTGAKRLTSLTALARGDGLSAGDLVEIRLSEASLNQDVTRYLQEGAQGVTVSNTKVQLRPGQVIFTGSVRQGVLAIDFTMTAHPAIQNGELVLVVDSIEPALVGQLSPVKPGQTIELAPNLEARTVTVTDGLMTVVGVVK